MQNNPLLLIEDFSETIAAIFKSFSQICKTHAEKMKETRPQYARLEEQIAEERKRRMELETLVSNRMKGKQNEKGNDTPTTLKRPKSGFQLFVMQEQERILREHPSLESQKIATLASIKWKNLRKQQQMAFEKKAEDMNKITDDELNASLKMNARNDAVYIKKEYNQEDEEEQNENMGEQKENMGELNSENNGNNGRNMESSQHESHMRDNNFDDGSREQQLRMNEQGGQEAANNPISIQNTMMMECEEDNQPTIRMEEHLPQETPPQQPQNDDNEQEEDEQ